ALVKRAKPPLDVRGSLDAVTRELASSPTALASLLREGCPDREHLRLLASNGHGYEVARGSPPREGVALLQGRAVCGRCGQHLRVRYRDARGKLESWYVCDRASGSRGEP